jgi:hypothetical protein
LSLFALGNPVLHQSNFSGNILWFHFPFHLYLLFCRAFTNISYTDILGKSVDETKRKTFFSVKQLVAGSVVLISAFLAKIALTSFAYPVNFAAMFFIGEASCWIASAVSGKSGKRNPLH